MDNREYVEKLYLREDELRKICNYHNIYNYNCEDIIQDLYVKLLTLKNIDRYVINNGPNMYIIFVIIRNLIFDFRKKESKYISNEIYDFDVIEESFDNEKYDFILNELESIDGVNQWFSKRILELYIGYNHSIRSLAKETKISFNVIQPIVHKFRIRCKENYEKSLKSN